MKDFKKIKEKIEKENDVEIIYLTESGSRLYGFDANEYSNCKGIFISGEKSLILGKDLESFEYNDENTTISLMSLQRFMSLIKKSEIGAISILFSMFREDTILSKKEVINEIKSRKDELITNNINSFWGFIYSQIKKIDIRDDRVKTIKEINKRLSEFKKQKLFTNITEIKEFITEFREMFKDLKNVEIKEVIDSVYIKVFGSCYEYNFPISKFIREMKRQEKSFGNKTSSTMEKIDKKRLAHSMRLAMECKELLTKGFITYPFEGEKKDIIKSIKLGLGDIEEQKRIILLSVDELQELKIKSKLRDSISKEVVEDIILLAYKS